MELLRNSCSPDAFLFYTSKMDSTAPSLETLLKTARFRGIIYHDSTDNSLNQQVNDTNASNNDIPSNVTHNASNSTATRKRSRRKTKPLNIQLDHSSVINLSSSSLSTDDRDICPFTWTHILSYTTTYQLVTSFSRHLRLFKTHATSRVFFLMKTAIPRQLNEHDTLLHNKSTWTPPPP